MEFAFLWLCDLQNSQNLTDEDSKSYMGKLDEIITGVLTSLGLENNWQPTGDGALLAFPGNTPIENILGFSLKICENVNCLREQGELNSEFYLRTYLTFGPVSIEKKENHVNITGSNAVYLTETLGKNKGPDRIVLKGEESSILLITENTWEMMSLGTHEDFIETFTDTTFNDQLLHIRTFKTSRIRLSIITKSTNQNDDIIKVLGQEIENLAKLQKEAENKFTVVLYNKDAFFAFYSALDRVLSSISVATIEASESDNIGMAINLFDENIQYDPLKMIRDNKYVKLILSDFCYGLLLEFSQFPREDYSQLSISKAENAPRVYLKDFIEKSKNRLVNSKPIVYFKEMTEQCIYLHAFDYGGINLIRQIAPDLEVDSDESGIDPIERYLTQQLEMGLILCDAVIIHSAELVRTPAVYNVLNKYKRFISDGSIKLLFSAQVDDIDRFFSKYITSKGMEYGKRSNKNPYVKFESDSLLIPSKDANRMNAVIQLLHECPVLLKRNHDGTHTLGSLFSDDISNNIRSIVFDEIVYCNDYTLLMNGNFTLFQLLSAKINDNNLNMSDIIPSTVVSEIIREISTRTSGTISASIVNGIIKENIDNYNANICSKYVAWYYALMNRSNILYAKINTGNFLYMDYIPKLWEESIFGYSAFCNTCAAFNPDGTIGVERISKIRISDRDILNDNEREKRMKIREKFREVYLSGRALELYMEKHFKSNDTLNLSYKAEAKELFSALCL